jgi:putative redox protein
MVGRRCRRKRTSIALARIPRREDDVTQASVAWVDGMQFVGESGSGHGIVIDASNEGGGHNAGARPMELLLLGVLGCTAMDVVSILKKKRQPLADLKVSATAEQAPDTPHYFAKIHIEYVAYGDVDEQALARSIQLSEERYCSAMATMRGVTQFSSSYRVVRPEPREQPAAVPA